MISDILKKIKNRKFGNVLYNLDQYGYSMVHIGTLRCLMASANSVEIFLTYAVKALGQLFEQKGACQCDEAPRPPRHRLEFPGLD